MTVEKIIWTQALSVGVDVFDEHHKMIILMINRLIDTQNSATDSETISDLLSRMTRYAQQHLKTEEKLMVEYGYPLYEQHKSEHVAYIKKTIDFCTAAQIGVNGLPKGLLNYLRSWWEEHIQNGDKAYRAFFNGIGIS
jgi:hemerythrin